MKKVDHQYILEFSFFFKKQKTNVPLYFSHSSESLSHFVGGWAWWKEGKGQQPAPSAANMLTSFGNFLRRLRNVGRAWYSGTRLNMSSRDNLQLILSLSVVDHFDGNFHIRFLGTLMAGFLSVERERDDDFNQMPHTNFATKHFHCQTRKSIAATIR